LNIAKMAANTKADADPCNVVAVYSDGLILYLGVSERTAGLVSEALKGHVTEYAASDDGMFHIWVCRGLEESLANMLLFSVPEIRTLDIALTDNRHYDDHTIDAYGRLLESVQGRENRP
jgi:hypothetical protein